jgi:hypothetical protein
MAARLGITVLQHDTVEIRGRNGDGMVRFVGATMWSDLSILPRGMTLKEAMSQSQRGWYEGGWRNYERNYHNDFREIRYRGSGSRNRFTPSQMLALHRESKKFFERVLATPFAGDTVAISTWGRPRASGPAIIPGCTAGPTCSM